MDEGKRGGKYGIDRGGGEILMREPEGKEEGKEERCGKKRRIGQGKVKVESRRMGR